MDASGCLKSIRSVSPNLDRGRQTYDTSFDRRRTATRQTSHYLSSVPASPSDRFLVHSLGMKRTPAICGEVLRCFENQPASGRAAKRALNSSGLLQLPAGSPELLQDLKSLIRAAQVRASFAVNRELVLLYCPSAKTFSLGKE
jgi:hypothetical protein